MRAPYRYSAIGKYGPASPKTLLALTSSRTALEVTYGGPGIQNNTMSPYRTNFVSIADLGLWWRAAEGDCVHFPIGDGEALKATEQDACSSDGRVNNAEYGAV